MSTMAGGLAPRAGRIAFGVVLLAGVAWLATVAWSGSFEPHPSFYLYHPPRLDAARIVGLTWLAAIAAGATAWGITGRVRWSHGSGSVIASSVVIPALGIALLLPLTLHMPLAAFLGYRGAFDHWVAVNVKITWFAHVVFAVLCAVRAYLLAAGRRAPSPVLIYVGTTIASCVPFGALFGIPPVVVAITGIPIVPLLYAMKWWIARERAELAALWALPRATAMLHRANHL